MQYPTISEYVKASQDASDNLEMSTKATDEELNEGIIDEYGVKYSKDGIKLLKSPRELDGTYSIKRGTKIICDEAFGRRISLNHSFLNGLVIPDSVIRIGKGAFANCSFLRSLVIPDSVTSIGDCAFSGCSSLSSLVLPDSVNTVGGDWAFWGCSSLSNIVIPDSVTSIGDWVFSGCSSLSNIVIPDSVTSIGDGAFKDCNFPDNLKHELISRFGDKIFRN